MKRLMLAFTMLLAPLAACDSGSGDDIQTIDAPLDGSSGPDGAGGGDAGADAAGACVLPTTTISCTVGNNAPCTAACAAAYCYGFGQVGNVCTNACTTGGTGQCPTGWSCNNMGRCRPPG